MHATRTRSCSRSAGAAGFLPSCTTRNSLPAGYRKVASTSPTLPRPSRACEETAEACLTALHESLNPGGLLILTLRPPAHSGRDTGSDGPPISLSLVRERWADRFEVVDVTVQLEDIHRVAVTLRKI